MSVFDSGIVIGNREPDPIEILISPGAGTVEGVVEDGPARITPGSVVALIPEARRIENRGQMLQDGFRSVGSCRATIRCTRGKAFRRTLIRA